MYRILLAISASKIIALGLQFSSILLMQHYAGLGLYGEYISVVSFVFFFCLPIGTALNVIATREGVNSEGHFGNRLVLSVALAGSILIGTIIVVHALIGFVRDERSVGAAVYCLVAGSALLFLVRSLYLGQIKAIGDHTGLVWLDGLLNSVIVLLTLLALQSLLGRLNLAHMLFAYFLSELVGTVVTVNRTLSASCSGLPRYKVFQLVDLLRYRVIANCVQSVNMNAIPYFVSIIYGYELAGAYKLIERVASTFSLPMQVAVSYGSSKALIFLKDSSRKDAWGFMARLVNMALVVQFSMLVAGSVILYSWFELQGSGPNLYLHGVVLLVCLYLVHSLPLVMKAPLWGCALLGLERQVLGATAVAVAAQSLLILIVAVFGLGSIELLACAAIVGAVLVNIGALDALKRDAGS